MPGIDGRALRMLAISAAVMLQGCFADSSSPDGSVVRSEPLLTTPAEILEKSLRCTPFEHEDKPPVLLLHGTLATGPMQYTLFYGSQLINLGFDVCTVNFPDRGLGDIQTSAEYVVYALRAIHERSGRSVAIIGHSYGSITPRWALKYWPSAREVTSDLVMIAGPQHGISVSKVANLISDLSDVIGPLPIGVLPEVFFQIGPDSQFIAALNAGDETPGDVDYTSLYTRFDEVVQPVTPVATAELEHGNRNPHLTNLLLQDLCPGHLTDHVTIGFTDPVSFALAVDAITHSGPANIERAGGDALCRLLPVDVPALLQAPHISGLMTVLTDALESGIPNPHLVAQEPPLKDYASATGTQ